MIGDGRERELPGTGSVSGSVSGTGAVSVSGTGAVSGTGSRSGSRSAAGTGAGRRSPKRLAFSPNPQPIAIAIAIPIASPKPKPNPRSAPVNRPRYPHPAVLLLFALLSCSEPTETQTLPRTGSVTGPITTEAAGDVWVFLYRPGEGPPGTPALPVAVTAVSSKRLESDPRYVIANVKPNAYRLSGLVDVDSDFDGNVDVLSQPTAGDRVSKPVDLQSQPGRGALVPITIDQPTFTEPPAFSLEGQVDQDVVLDFALDAITPLTLIADPVGHFDPKKVGFTFGLVDADGDLRPDDVDGDGTADLSLQVFLRWLPRPGQLDEGTTVIVPLVFDPSPFIRTLEGRLGVTVTATRLQVVMVPVAQALGPTEDGGTGLRTFGAPPAGDYELFALAAGGQFWRIPNQLPLESQNLRLHIDRVSR